MSPFVDAEQNGSIELKPLPASGEIYAVKVKEHDDCPPRCQSVPAKDIQRLSFTGIVSSYRPNSSHQYLSSVALKDSTIQETNLRLGKPTRTS